MPTRSTLKARRITLITMGFLLLATALYNGTQKHSHHLSETFLIAESSYGDLVSHYENRMAPIRSKLAVGQSVDCCIDGMPRRDNMRAGLQLDATRYALLPAIVHQAQAVTKLNPVVLDFDSDAALKAELKVITNLHPGARVIVDTDQGAALVELPPDAAYPAFINRATTQP